MNIDQSVGEARKHHFEIDIRNSVTIISSCSLRLTSALTRMKLSFLYCMNQEIIIAVD